MKYVAIVLSFVSLFLIYDLIYGHNGIKEMQEVEAQLELAQQTALQLQQRNQVVVDQIKDLQQGSIAVEELARSELGLIKPNERFYRVLATDDKIRSMPIVFK